MGKFIKILILLGLVMTFSLQVEAKTYTNTRLGIAIDIPDYFVERNNLALAGSHDFFADGGDDYGSENLRRGGEGMDISISSQPCEYQNVSIEFLQQQIQQYRAAARIFGIIPILPTIVKIPPGHPVIFGSNYIPPDKFNVYVTAYLHGNKIDICMNGTKNNHEKIYSIMASLRCTAH